MAIKTTAFPPMVIMPEKQLNKARVINSGESAKLTNVWFEFISVLFVRILMLFTSYCIGKFEANLVFPVAKRHRFHHNDFIKLDGKELSSICQSRLDVYQMII